MDKQTTIILNTHIFLPKTQRRFLDSLCNFFIQSIGLDNMRRTAKIKQIKESRCALVKSKPQQRWVKTIAALDG